MSAAAREDRPPVGAYRELGVPASGARTPRWSGLVVVDKPSGVTSHDVVLKIRRRLRDKRAGHLGTLDPAASGVLVVAMGAATRCIPVWQGGRKTYEGTVRFGVVTSTQDMQGEILEQREASVTEAAVREATRAFVGDLMQVPPMVSALKVGGQRLYRLARRGETIERAPRPVRVDRWEWLGFDLPDARFRVQCSGGTYVRTLAHDLGKSLGVGGALAALRRTRSEPFSLERSVPLRALDTETREAVLERAGHPLDDALGTLPGITLDEAAVEHAGFGGRPSLAVGTCGTSDALVEKGPRSIVLRDPRGRAIALGELLRDPARDGHVLVCPHVVFPWAVRQGHSSEEGFQG